VYYPKSLFGKCYEGIGYQKQATLATVGGRVHDCAPDRKEKVRGSSMQTALSEGEDGSLAVEKKAQFFSCYSSARERTGNFEPWDRAEETRIETPGRTLHTFENT